MRRRGTPHMPVRDLIRPAGHTCMGSVLPGLYQWAVWRMLYCDRCIMWYLRNTYSTCVDYISMIHHAWPYDYCVPSTTVCKRSIVCILYWWVDMHQQHTWHVHCCKHDWEQYNLRLIVISSGQYVNIHANYNCIANGQYIDCGISLTYHWCIVYFGIISPQKSLVLTWCLPSVH